MKIIVWMKMKTLMTLILRILINTMRGRWVMTAKRTLKVGLVVLNTNDFKLEKQKRNRGGASTDSR